MHSNVNTHSVHNLWINTHTLHIHVFVSVWPVLMHHWWNLLTYYYDETVSWTWLQFNNYSLRFCFENFGACNYFRFLIFWTTKKTWNMFLVYHSNERFLSPSNPIGAKAVPAISIQCPCSVRVLHGEQL